MFFFFIKPFNSIQFLIECITLAMVYNLFSDFASPTLVSYPTISLHSLQIVSEFFPEYYFSSDLRCSQLEGAELQGN